MLKVAILGSTGYTGSELIRLLQGHPEVEIVFASSESNAGDNINAVHPQFNKVVDLKLQAMQADQIPPSVDLVFCALPHGSSIKTVHELVDRNYKVIDLSADFRLKKAHLYAEWYGYSHSSPQLLDQFVYGLPELYHREIAEASLVANPGCYPTSIILALAPLLSKKMVKPSSIIVDAKSGVSGAGRSPKQAFHFPECTENFKAYRVATHQHTPEIEQELGRLAEAETVITFTPHLVPMIRGILSTIYLELAVPANVEQLYELYDHFYQYNKFIRLLQPPCYPETRFVRGTNFCDIALKKDQRTNRLIVISAIDNLVKGAAGQAIQNMNIIYRYPENLGLDHIAI